VIDCRHVVFPGKKISEKMHIPRKLVLHFKFVSWRGKLVIYLFLQKNYCALILTEVFSDFFISGKLGLLPDD